CALLRKKFKEDLFTYCIENGILQASFEPSNDNTNVVNALQELFVVNQDPGKTSSQSPPQINHHCCYGCGDPLEDIFSINVLVLSLAWEIILEIELAFEDKHCQPEDILELFQRLHNDVQNIHEPDNSLSMGDEHFDTVSTTESDEFIKSSVKSLVPIPSESEGIPDNICDVPFHDNSPPLDVSKDQFEDFFDSNDDSTLYDNDSFSIDNIDSSSLMDLHGNTSKGRPTAVSQEVKRWLRSTHFYRLSHSEIVDIEEVAVHSTGSESRPPMLNKENYVPWSSRLLRYGDTNWEVPVNETFHVQTDDELNEKELKQIEDDDQAIQTIFLGLPEDIYAAVDSCETAQEIWLRVQQMMKGSDIGIQEKNAKLFNEWERFTSNEGESIESYYHRFLKLMNDLKQNKHFSKKIASNLKFLNNLQPEWSRRVTIVHQTKDLHTADYTQLYDFLKYNQKEVDELKAK
nr:hypothetical protein [Tanacetum cinerariifolium]